VGGRTREGTRKTKPNETKRNQTFRETNSECRMQSCGLWSVLVFHVSDVSGCFMGWSHVKTTLRSAPQSAPNVSQTQTPKPLTLTLRQPPKAFIPGPVPLPTPPPPLIRAPHLLLPLLLPDPTIQYPPPEDVLEAEGGGEGRGVVLAGTGGAVTTRADLEVEGTVYFVFFGSCGEGCCVVLCGVVGWVGGDTRV